ncbi:hypothetical protein MATL_G00116330 [Megalops atlanticus]|uniref:Multidrug and toxin extrusion protein n=1 Tax=Megalops atlanticus TaxID=7932 RepID=A0A9D3Q250_MEGAT|nr:hypothetical protein MATL_G00116330 [Megalops atlanticus]
METIQATTGETNGNLHYDPATHSTSSPQTVYSGCMRRLRDWIPIHYKEEIVQLLKLAGPVFFAQLLGFFIGFISTVFCGHLGETELAGVALATAVINVTGLSIGSGLSSACDTLMSQTFGGSNLKRVGVILQRGILILLLACFPCWALLINTESILLAVKQSPEVARMSQMYVKIFMPALPAAFLYQLEGRYLHNQGIIWPQVVTGVVGNVINALVNYIFLYVLDLGVAGSAAANTISQYSLAMFLYAYIRWKGLHKATWAGWSMDCLQEWGAFIYLAIPSMLMLCLEWWTYEIGGFLAGVVSEMELGAQSVIYELATVAYMFPLGFGVAASVRVGNALGAGNTEQAKLSGKLAMTCAAVVAVCVAVTIGASKDVISYIFTNDLQIRKRVGEVMVLYAPFHLCDAMAGVAGGIVRGMARQKIGAFCNLVGYYFVGFPIGVSLMFVAKMGIFGLWSGLLVCVALQAAFFVTLTIKLDWKKATDEALIRAGAQVPEEGGEQVYAMEKQAGSQEGAWAAHLEEPGPWEFGSDLDGLQEREGRAAPAGAAVSTVGALLSFRQLVIRRGLTLCAMLSILAVGIITNVLLTATLR